MKLGQIARQIKSNNAGATFLTFDVIFPDAASFEHVVASGAINADVVAAAYRLRRDDVRIFSFPPTLTIKVTIPRSYPSGGLMERDFDGVQQYAPFLDFEVPGR